MPNMNAEMLEWFNKGMSAAQAAAVPEPTAMTLATVGESGRPSARIVLLKQVDEAGFVFYTNITSHKGRQLTADNRAALVFWWREIEQQVRVEGRVTPVMDAEADEYFATRPRISQLGAWASQQSAALDDRATLESALKAAEARFGDGPIPRPPHWSGYRVSPDLVEFWYGRAYRLHERHCFEWRRGAWDHRLLYP